MNTYNEGNLPIHHLTEDTRVSLTLLHANFLQEHSSKPQTPLSTSLLKSVNSTLQQDDFTTRVPATGGITASSKCAWMNTCFITRCRSNQPFSLATATAIFTLAGDGVEANVSEESTL